MEWNGMEWSASSCVPSKWLGCSCGINVLPGRRSSSSKFVFHPPITLVRITISPIALASCVDTNRCSERVSAPVENDKQRNRVFLFILFSQSERSTGTCTTTCPTSAKHLFGRIVLAILPPGEFCTIGRGRGKGDDLERVKHYNRIASSRVKLKTNSWF